MTEPTSTLTYRGLTFDDDGISKGRRRKRVLEWNEVTDVATTIEQGQLTWYYETTLWSESHGRLAITCVKRLTPFENLPDYCQLLTLVMDRVPTDLVCDMTRLVARWGTSPDEVDEMASAIHHDQYANEALLKSLAKHHWARLEYRKARKLFQKVLEIKPDDTESLEFLALMDCQSIKGFETIVRQYEYLVTLDPNSQRYLRTLAMLLLDADDERGEEYADRLLKMDPDDFRAVRSLAAYHFRKGAFIQAKAVAQQLKDAASSNPVKEEMEAWIDYVERYETDESFRKKERQRQFLRAAAWFVGLILTALVPILILLYGIVRHILSDKPVP